MADSTYREIDGSRGVALADDRWKRIEALRAAADAAARHNLARQAWELALRHWCEADHPGWLRREIADAVDCSMPTVTRHQQLARRRPPPPDQEVPDPETVLSLRDWARYTECQRIRAIVAAFKAGATCREVKTMAGGSWSRLKSLRRQAGLPPRRQRPQK